MAKDKVRCMNLTESILREVYQHRLGIGCRPLFYKLDLDDLASFRVMLSNMTKRGLLYKDMKETCQECYCSYVCYRIGEKGREYLARKDMRC